MSPVDCVIIGHYEPDFGAAVQISQHSNQLDLTVGPRGEIGVSGISRHRQPSSVDTLEKRLRGVGRLMETARCGTVIFPT